MLNTKNPSLMTVTFITHNKVWLEFEGTIIMNIPCDSTEFIHKKSMPPDTMPKMNIVILFTKYIVTFRVHSVTCYMFLMASIFYIYFFNYISCHHNLLYYVRWTQIKLNCTELLNAIIPFEHLYQKVCRVGRAKSFTNFL